MAAPMEVSTIPKIDWLYPQLLSKEGLVEILSQRYVQLPDDPEKLTKDDLLELYYKFIIPRPQREYRPNRRGQIMTRKQILSSKKRKMTGPDFTQPPTKKAATQSSGLINSFDGVGVGNRLKPPPSCINFEKKIIKLGSSKPQNLSSTSTTPTTISAPGSNDKTTTAPTELKVIKLDGSASSPTSQGKAVALNKTAVSGDAEKDGKPAPMETGEANPSPARKLKRIAWP